MNSNGFDDEKLKLFVNTKEIDNLLKKYKKVKKYMKSPLYAVKVIDGTEKYVSKLLEDTQENG